MNTAEFADAVRDLVYLDLDTGERSRESDRTYLSVRGTTDFAEQVTLLLDEHDIDNLEFATRHKVEAARRSYGRETVQIDDNAVMSAGGYVAGVWVSAWVWLADEADVDEKLQSRLNFFNDFRGDGAALAPQFEFAEIVEGRFDGVRVMPAA